MGERVSHSDLALGRLRDIVNSTIISTCLNSKSNFSCLIAQMPLFEGKAFTRSVIFNCLIDFTVFNQHVSSLAFVNQAYF
ncbi:unnamed protein product [Camellia sinensis]